MQRFLFALATVVASAPFCQAAERVDYLREVKPILKARCYACHGALQQKARLRLDTVALMRKGGRHGAVIQPQDSSASLLVERVSAADDASRMPREGKPLSPEQITLLKRWIDQGATGPADEKAEEDPRQHWAFQRPVRPAVPTAPNGASIRNPVDAFCLSEQVKLGILPSPSADPATLLRRLYLDLIGLPPTREQLHAFLLDPSVDAYEKIVDQLLDSPQYGERWARHWMDVWRYSDWYGRRTVPDVMNSYPQIWRWRDWIVRSLNEDKGYDRMVQEMLAADELAPDDDSSIVATGFLVRNWYKWNYNQWMRDNVEHTAKAFLGLTLNCCHCHDHKYDPITQKEYFQFRAFFEPLELRHDRWPGEPDPGPFQKYVYGVAYGPIRSGMIRVLDEKLDAQTFMYAGGDERNRIPNRPPVQPGAPASLGGDRLLIEPVKLPPTAVCPSLKPYVLREERAKRRSAITAAEAEGIAARAALENALTAARPARIAWLLTALPAHVSIPNLCIAVGMCTPQSTAKGNVSPLQVLAAKPQHLSLAVTVGRLASARAEMASFEERIAAEKCKYGVSPGNAVELSRAASGAERRARLMNARLELAVAEQQFAAAQGGSSATRAAHAGEVQTASGRVGKARESVRHAQASLGQASSTYTPLGPTYPSTSTGRRRALAAWITDKSNPLTARVAVNYIWSWHFGRPLVETTFNFGRSGKRPSNPPLLDWLAVELMEGGWHMKRLHRLIVTSNVYRIRSHFSTESRPSLQQDPDNRLLWHFPTTRMDAEEVRDSLLGAAGALDLRMGGPEIPHEQGLTVHRRSLYFAHHGESKMEFLELFDAANPSECYRRTSSVLPQQALALSNSELTLHQGRVLAQKLWAELPAAHRDAGHFIDAAFEQVLGRTPTEAERTAAEGFLMRQQGLFRDQKLIAATPGGPSIDPAMRALENLVIGLFNHNDFITVR
jgi:Protein of unknown function (DUF1553)/Protein of unknown function (DUF1549)/Planctomycete cytochrome C